MKIGEELKKALVRHETEINENKDKESVYRIRETLARIIARTMLLRKQSS